MEKKSLIHSPGSFSPDTRPVSVIGELPVVLEERDAIALKYMNEMNEEMRVGMLDQYPWLAAHLAYLEAQLDVIQVRQSASLNESFTQIH